MCVSLSKNIKTQRTNNKKMEEKQATTVPVMSTDHAGKISFAADIHDYSIKMDLVINNGRTIDPRRLQGYLVNVLAGNVDIDTCKNLAKSIYIAVDASRVKIVISKLDDDGMKWSVAGEMKARKRKHAAAEEEEE